MGDDYHLIDGYLQRLRARLRLPSERRDEIVAEARDHLVEDAERLRTSGLASNDAQHLALGRFGDAAEIAASFNAARPAWRRRLALGAPLLALALGVSATIAVVAHPAGNDGGLAREIGFTWARFQEPSNIEINGIPIPKDADAETRRDLELLEQRMSVLDG